MFGRSTSSRFSESKSYTPGPGEYDSNKSLSTTKKGFSMGVGERKLHRLSEFCHLGPGTYAINNENSLLEHRPLPSVSSDVESAVKRLTTTYQKFCGSSNPKNTSSTVTREEILSMLAKLFSECLSATGEVSRVKGELDQLQGRVHDETNLAIKPSKSSGNAGLPAAWKKIEPLQKALGNTGAELDKKVMKISSILGSVAEEFPALAYFLSEDPRLSMLNGRVEALESELEEANLQVETLSSQLKQFEEEKAVVEAMLLGANREKVRMSQRSLSLESVIEKQKTVIQELESSLEDAHVGHEQFLASLQNLAVRAEDETSLHDDLLEMTSRCERLMASEEASFHHVADLQAELTASFLEAEQAAQSYQAEIGEMGGKHCALLLEISGLTDQLIQSGRACQKLESQAVMLRSQNKKLKACVLMADAYLQEAEDAKEVEVCDELGEVEDSSCHMDTMEVDIFERACQTIHQLLAECDECWKELTDAQGLNKESELEKFAMVEEHQEAVVRFQSEISNLISEKDELINCLRQLSQQHDDIMEQNRTLQDTLETRDAEIKASNSKLSDICNLFAETQSNFVCLQEGIRSKVDKELHILVDKYNNSVQETWRLEGQIAEINNNLRKTSDQLLKAEAENDETKQTIQNNETSILQLRSEIQTAQKQMNQTTQELAQTKE
eukprot:768635-Hanusia_phi.AAC.15